MRFASISLVLLSILMFTCKIDHGLTPQPGKLVARITFRGTPPTNTQGIYLVVAPQFPPHAINELFHSPNSLPIGVDSVTTEIYLPFGHYDATSLWWYNTETKSNLADVIALNLDKDNNLLPESFDLNEQHPVAETRLFANWSRVDRDCSIEGTIYFNGPFPKNTLATAIAAFRYKPESNVHYLVWLKSIDFAVDSNPYDFKLPVRHGSVDYLAVFWLPERASLTDFSVVGIYEDPARPGEVGMFSLSPGETIKDIKINADWSLIGSGPL